MDTRWLLMWLYAPVFSAGAIAVEAISLQWYVLEEISGGGHHANRHR